MGLDSGWQKVTVLGIVAGVVVVAIFSAAWLFHPLSDANTQSFGDWLDAHSAAIWGFLVGAVPAITSVAAYIFGKSSGTTAGKTTAFKESVTAARGRQSGDTAANSITAAARRHGIQITLDD